MHFSSTLNGTSLALFYPIRVSCCAWCLTYVASNLHSIKRSKVWFPQTTTCPSFCSITHCNYFKQPQGGYLKYSLTSIKRPPIKRPPSIKRPLCKIPIYLSVICCTSYLYLTATSIKRPQPPFCSRKCIIYMGFHLH